MRSSSRRAVRLILTLLLTVASTAFVVTASSGPAAADYTGNNVPDWAIGPFTRYASNPILSPQGTGFESDETYNPGVLFRNGKYHMLYRGQHGNTSQIGYATSTDGRNYTRYAGNPVIKNTLSNEVNGLEDPRLFELNGTYYTFYTASHNGTFDLNLATSTDLVNWTKLGPVIPKNKNGAVVADPSGHPVLINGKYELYYGGRAANGCSTAGCGTGVAYSTDMVHWSGFTPVNLQLPNSFAPVEVSVAVTDYQTVQGAPLNRNINLFIAGGLMSRGRWYYAVSEVNMSRADPTKVIGQLTDTIISPKAPYELDGLKDNTIFMNTIMFQDGQWMMNYGGGDKVVALGTAGLRSAPASQFSSTGLETGQRLPDWIDAIDTDGGRAAGGTANVGPLPNRNLLGPEASTRTGVAHDGNTALMYSGLAAGAAKNYAYMKLFDLATPRTIGAKTMLSYWIYPQSASQSAGVTGDNSTCVAVDADLTDGTALRNSALTDQGGGALRPKSQCGRLTLGAWNHVTANLGSLSGKQISRITIGFDRPNGTGGYRGYVDDISITG